MARRSRAAVAADPDGLTNQQRIGIDAWLRGETQIAAAKAAGVEITSMWRWLREPAVTAYVTKVRKAQAETSWAALFDIQEKRYQRLSNLWDSLTETSDFYLARREDCEDTSKPGEGGVGLQLCADKGQYFPGAASGALTSRAEILGSGENAREITRWEWQIGLLREIRDLEREILEEQRKAGRDLHDARQRIANIELTKKRGQLLDAQIEAIKSGNLSGAGTEPVKLTAVQIVEARRDPTEES